MAETGGADLHQHLVRARVADLEVVDNQGFLAVEQNAFHQFSSVVGLIHLVRTGASFFDGGPAGFCPNLAPI
ncbi:hypothetical protein GCM10023205_56500 [Yinghuangia aomiensis]|uniref:Uncharacterized protein n=1 Tax=Yinghuangia aomiensis TaxID=676205 RepID=A0ABP9HX67_9ACTN